MQNFNAGKKPTKLSNSYSFKKTENSSLISGLAIEEYIVIFGMIVASLNYVYKYTCATLVDKRNTSCQTQGRHDRRIKLIFFLRLFLKERV